jgi:hypothetical protein
METVTKWIVGWLYLMIPGFVYLVGLFLLWQHLTRDKFFKMKEFHSGWFPYFFILIIIFSYIIGLSAHLTFQKVLYWFSQDFAKVAKELKNKLLKFQIDLAYCYQYLVMWRHLFLATFLLGVILFIKEFKSKIKWVVLIVFIIILLIIGLTYIKQKEIYKSFDEKDPKYTTTLIESGAITPQII